MFHCIVQPRHDWGPPDLYNAFPDIRMQLSEQTRVLEARAEATAGVAGELHDYCRRRADLEHDYARALDKLARAAAQRHKDQKHKYALTLLPLRTTALVYILSQTAKFD
ncbi:uncharacterized protein LOC111362938 isoform X2 [Spodoptera litura]|uniref:Uncharacterized protein LOC111362938 isoform X2 n=1 Tax=Spodoptera litura TaxID=69820 RepID=A0A9J7EU77_SPOLT|nr:uncharacterized protein LOC111362938 isoform X2 [Spodoptera litura]